MAKENSKVISKEEIESFLSVISVIGNSEIAGDTGEIYYSKIDGSYLTRVGMEDRIEFLISNGITEQIQGSYKGSKVSSIGFNPVEQKWYGWSHRAIFGFGIGSKVAKGSAGFIPSSKEEFKEDMLAFWGDTDLKGSYKKNASAIEYVQNDVPGVLVQYTYTQDVPNRSISGTTTLTFCKYPEVFGRGEWVAETLDDAKQMAIDFARSVS